MESLSRMGAPAIVPLTEALKDKHIQVRRVAVEAIAKVGPAAKEAIPALIGALKDQDCRQPGGGGRLGERGACPLCRLCSPHTKMPTPKAASRSSPQSPGWGRRRRRPFRFWLRH